MGRTELWQPVADRLSSTASKILLGWPGFSTTAPDPLVNGIGDLVDAVLARMDRPTALVAQSMGGVIALQAALKKPESVTGLVLAATSGGIDVASLGGEDWRPSFLAAHPDLPRWFSAYRRDMSSELSALTVPTLLLWGDADPVSPVAVGERLAALLAGSDLHIVKGGDHDFVASHAEEVAGLVDRFLGPAAP